MLIFQIIIVQVFIFAALVFVLMKVMFSSSTQETKRLQELNDENMKKTRELEGKIEAAQAQYRKKLMEAENDVRKVREKAREEGEQIKEEMIAQAKQERQRIIANAINSTEKIREEIENQMQGKCMGIASKMIQVIMNSKHQKLLHEGCVEEILDEFKNIKKEIIKGPDKEEIQCLVTSAYSLSQDQRKRLEEMLISQIDAKCIITERVNDDIIAGLVIKLDNFIVDGSLMARFKEASKNI